jgi:hypothetical protein
LGKRVEVLVNRGDWILQSLDPLRHTSALLLSHALILLLTVMRTQHARVTPQHSCRQQAAMAVFGLP